MHEKSNGSVVTLESANDIDKILMFAKGIAAEHERGILVIDRDPDNTWVQFQPYSNGAAGKGVTEFIAKRLQLKLQDKLPDFVVTCHSTEVNGSLAYSIRVE